MNKGTRQKVEELLKEYVTRLTKVDYSLEELKMAYPFHSLFFRDEAIIAFKRQRSIMTSLGQGLYPRLSKIIAEQHYKDVHLNHEFREKAEGEIAVTIDRIITELRVKQRKPNHEEEVKELLNARGGKSRELVVTADLYIGDFTGGPFFAEIKSPLPNLDVTAESKKKILTFIALHRGKNPSGYLAFAYNPFITRAAYHHSFTKQIMDMERQVLMGEEFWDKIGGNGCYQELLEIITQVKKKLPIRGRRKRR